MVINNELFTEVATKGIPDMNPLSREYKEWWKEQRDRCVYGYTVGGKWMPGRLYYYVNFFPIERNVKDSKRKILALPDLRDVEWEVFPLIEKAKGHSGFDENGRPVYDNEAKGFMMIGGRDYGKSFIAAANVAYEYSFFANNEIVMSAHETKYTDLTMSKAKQGIDSMPGGLEFAEEYYPPPFSHSRVKDDWSKEVRSGVKETLDGVQITRGYNSRILVRIYKDNPLAANGTRPSFHVMEEVGKFPNLLKAYNSSIPCWMDGASQFGTPFLIGTGGDMDKGSLETQKMFYDPESFNLLSFNDDYDNSGGKIAYFVPATMGANQFKDEHGNTDFDKAKEKLLERRESKKRDKTSYEQELQYYPLVPKEAFLVTTGNIFPTYLLEEQLAYLMSSKATEFMGQKGTLEFDKNGEVKWNPDDSLFEVDFPHNQNTKTKGCITIYEHPQKVPVQQADGKEAQEIPGGLYIGGCDPIDQDTAFTSNSLGSIFIYKRFWSMDRTYDYIVAEYTGRPDTSAEFYENVRKLCTYYNCKVLYENMLKGLKQHFEHKKCLHLLREQPSILKEVIPDGKVQRTYGVHMTKEIKAYCMGLIRDWLLEEYAEGKHNVRKLHSVNLIKELIHYNNDHNFDRVISFGLTLLHKKELHRVIVKDQEAKEQQNGVLKPLFEKDGW